MDEDLKEYRKLLIKAEQKAQQDFDKTVLSLSSGAIGVSLVFLRDVIGANATSNSSLLLWSWIVWTASVTCVLLSFYVSQQALRRAITQVDQGSVYGQTPGGYWSCLIDVLNPTGGLLFLVGVVLTIIFAWQNWR